MHKFPVKGWSRHSHECFKAEAFTCFDSKFFKVHRSTLYLTLKFVCICLDNKTSTLPFFPRFSAQRSSFNTQLPSIKRENRVLSRYLKIKLCHFATVFFFSEFFFLLQFKLCSLSTEGWLCKLCIVDFQLLKLCAEFCFGQKTEGQEEKALKTQRFTGTSQECYVT